ncbi:MAG: energy-coupling factor transporter transmembrane component T [Anaerolineae bacterium]|jgi:energy-coupling factor transport system permease protein
MLDARVWLVWALVTLVGASSTRNPMYIIVLLLTAVVVGGSCGKDEGRRSLLSPLNFAVVAVPLSALFNAFTVHVGDTILFSLPKWLPLMGGAITLEALCFGALNGLALTTIFSAFSVFNQVTPVRDLIRLTPRAFHEGGVVLSIALTFMPQTTRSLNRIREAQVVRGHRVRGVRDWLPIVVPLLVSGLERAMGLAEAMVARGYGAVSGEEQPLVARGLLLLGLTSLLGGWLAYLFRPTRRLVAASIMLVGAALLGVVARLIGRRVRRTVYRARRWTIGDTFAVLGCGLTFVVALTQREALHYSPYPQLTLPAFDSLVGLGLLGLLLPALVAVNQDSPERCGGNGAKLRRRGETNDRR